MPSEVTRLKEAIALEYLAAKWGLEGLRYGTGQHPFISRRMEQMEEKRQQLNALVGEKVGIPLFAETLAHLPERPTRHHLQKVLRNELGKTKEIETEEIELLIEHVLAAWETFDLLSVRFGKETAQKILTTSSESADVVPS